MNLKFRNIFSVCMMLFVGTVSAQTIFVSTKGNDHWAGTNRRPVATIDRYRFAAANRATRGRESCYLRPRVALPSAANRQLVKLFRKREIGESLFWNMSLFRGQRPQTKIARGFLLDFERPGCEGATANL